MMASTNRFIGLICFIGSIGYAKSRYSAIPIDKSMQPVKLIKPIKQIKPI
jgi:hypothetical protein